MSNQDLSKIKGQTPLSVIVHGGNYISFLLAKTLLEQGSHVVIIDRYTNSSKQYFSELKKSGKVTFIDFKGIKSFYEKIARIDYLYYMLGEKVEENNSLEIIDSKDFLSETDYLNISLTSANKYKAKISLITSLRLNRELSNRVNNQKDGKTKPYSPLELQRYGENYAAEFVDKTKANLRIIRLGTVIGRGVNQIRDDILHKLFTDATQKHQIEIDGEGLELHNLVHESDAIYGILKLTFSDDTKGEVISLCNKNDYTTLSLAYKLLELDVEAKAIKFFEREDSSAVLQDLYVSAPSAQQHGWKQNVSLEEAVVAQVQAYYERSDKKWEIDKTKGSRKSTTQESMANVKQTKLGEIFSSLMSPFKVIRKPSLLFQSINFASILKKFLFGISIFLLVYYLIGPVIGISLGTLLIYNRGSALRTSISNLDLEEIENITGDISKNTLRVEDNLNRVYWIFQLTNSRDTFENINQIIQGTKYVTESSQDLLESLRPFGEFLKDYEPSLTPQGASNVNIREYSTYLKALDGNRYLLREGIYKMTLAENLITTVETNKLPKVMREYVLDYKDLITNINSVINPLEEVSLFLPDLLGSEGRKRYLILLQDDGEIRSTGGWISTYAIITIEGGQIREMFVDDIYNAQATLRLQGHNYKAPSTLSKALGDITYSFPLVNWNPSLDTVMLTSEQYIYDLEKGNSLDGVITLDITVLRNLLNRWGGVEVPGESTLITADALYGRIFEGSKGSAPTDIRNSIFLTDLFDSVLKRVFSSKVDGYKEIFDVLRDGLNEKHISVTFKNSTAKNFVDKNMWDSNLDSKFESAPINIDWNWGANKANIYTKKSHTLDIEIQNENIIDYKYQIGVENDADSNVYPQGEYVNYLRVYIPLNATVTGIKGFEENRYDMYQEDEHTVIGGWFNVEVKETKVLEIKYRISQPIFNNSHILAKSDTHYDMNINIYKQPGSKNDGYNLNITYPEKWELESYEGLTSIQNSLNGRFELSSDETFHISWKR